MRGKLIHAGFCGVTEISARIERDPCHSITDALHACDDRMVIPTINAVPAFAFGHMSFDTAKDLCLRHDVFPLQFRQIDLLGVGESMIERVGVLALNHGAYCVFRTCDNVDILSAIAQSNKP